MHTDGQSDISNSRATPLQLKMKFSINTICYNVKSLFIFLVKAGVFQKEIKRIQKWWKRTILNNNPNPNTVPEITTAASLAYHGLLGSVAYASLNGDLSTVPAEHQISLTSSVTECLEIDNVRGCDLVGVLDSSIKCKQINIRDQSLGSEETQALIRAIMSREGSAGYVDVESDVKVDTTFLAFWSSIGMGCYLLGFVYCF